MSTARAQTPAADRLRLHKTLDRIDSLLRVEAYKTADPMSDSLLLQAKAFAAANAEDTTYIRAVFTRGRVLFYNGKYELAIKCFTECKPLVDKFYGEKSEWAARVLTNLGISYAENKDPLKAIGLHQEAIEIYKLKKDPWMPALADAWNNLGNAQADARNNKQAIESYTEALRIRVHNGGPNSIGKANLYQNIASCYLALGEVDEAIHGYLAAIAIYGKNPAAKPVSHANAWYNLAICYEYTGKLEDALICQQRALELRLPGLGEQHPTVLKSFRGLANVYRKMGDLERAETYLNKVLESRRTTLKPGNVELTNSFIDVGAMAANRKDWQKAETMFRLAVASELAAAKIDSLHMARTLFNYGSFKYRQNLPDSALALHRTALTYHPENYKGYEDVTASIYGNMAECYQIKKDVAKADSFYQVSHALRKKEKKRAPSFYSYTYREIASCRILQGRFEEASALLDSVFQVLNVSDALHWEKVSSPDELANTLTVRSRLHLAWAATAEKMENLKAALLWGDTALAFINVWEKEFAGSSSRRYTREMARDAHELCLAALFELKETDTANRSKWLDYAFSQMEAVHNTQLHNTLLDAKERQPDERIHPDKAKAYQLKSDIAEAEKQIYLMRANGLQEANDSLRTQVDLVFSLKQQLDTMLLRSPQEPTAPTRSVSLAQARKDAIRPGQILIEYVVTDTSVYIFYAGKRGADVIKVPLDFDLDACVQHFRHGLTGYYSQSAEYRQQHPELYENTLREYIESAVLLYKKLILPLKAFIGPDKDLIIIPDGILNLVPFQALLEGKPEFLQDFESYPFLAKKYNIGMAFSTSLHMEMSIPVKRPAGKRSSLVMAPFFTDDPAELPGRSLQPSDKRFDLQPLAFSGMEAYKVSKSLGFVKSLYGRHALLDSFNLYAPQSRILHLSTHAVADGRFGAYCYILFGKEGEIYRKLYVCDIYNQKMPADLVTLSSCESALGEFQKGEGLIGLTRAFAYAGARSIVSSVWQVNDGSTAELMDYFYHYLMSPDHLTKDRALASACRIFLDSNRSNVTKHPYFWAAFQLTGAQTPLR